MPALNQPIDPLVAALVETLDPTLREAFEERAGIIEFDGKKERAHAECLALLDVLYRHPLSVRGTPIPWMRLHCPRPLCR